MKFIHYRHFVDTIMTEDEAKAEAAEAIINGLDDRGQTIQVIYIKGCIHTFLSLRMLVLLQTTHMIIIKKLNFRSF